VSFDYLNTTSCVQFNVGRGEGFRQAYLIFFAKNTLMLMIN